MIVGSLLLILVAVTLLVMGLAVGSSVLLISSIAASLLAAVALVVGARQAAATRAATGPARPLAVDLDDDPGPAAATLDEQADSDDRPGGTWSSVADRDIDRPADTEMLPGEQFGRAFVDSDTAEMPRSDSGHDSSAYPPDDDSWPDVTADADRSPGTDPDASGVDGSNSPPYAGLADPAQAGRDDALAQLAADDTEEDPADEPTPQRVQPADAVRVSRMTVDVLVVDGRPRYHLADCPHLDDRESEPLPVAEAVDLGFTPCGLCRPVDRLVAEAVRR